MGDGDEDGGGGMWNHPSSSSSSYCILHRGSGGGGGGNNVGSSGNSDSGAGAGAGGGICALCLQDKLGKLVSSDATASFPFLSPLPPPPPPPCNVDSIHPFFPPPSSSSSSSSAAATSRSKIHWLVSAIHRNHRSKFNNRAGIASPPPPPSAAAANPQQQVSSMANGHEKVDGGSRRSGTATPRKENKDSQKKRKGLSIIWSLLPSSSSSSSNPPCPASTATAIESQSHLLFGRTGESKVPRSRSLGCGSRSFSSDFLDRISNGFSDCTLRRVESHREHTSVKSNANNSSLAILSPPSEHDTHHPSSSRMPQCSRMFGIRGYKMMNSSSSDQNGPANDNKDSMSIHGESGRSRNYWSWVYTMASPMRAFHPSSSSSSTSHQHLNVAPKSPSPSLMSHNHEKIINNDVLVINGNNDQGKMINIRGTLAAREKGT